MASIHDYINADTSQNKDLISFLKNAPKELPDDPVDLYETTIKIELDKIRSLGQTPNYFKESFLAIEVDKVKSFPESDGLIRVFVGYVVHPGDSGFDIKDLISIPRSDDNKARWNITLRDRFYITGPDKDGTFPANKGVVDVRPTPPVIEEPTDSKTFQYDGDLLKDIEKFTNDGMRCIRENPKFFLQNYSLLVRRTLLNAKIRKFAHDKEHRNRFYRALNMFKDGPMTSIKRKKAAADFHKVDYEEFKKVVGSATGLRLMNKNIQI